MTPPRLPPLNALRVFHVAVRHRSLRCAAEELRVSPQAVSQQIKLLEDTLGTELFTRKGRTIEPNDKAILLSHFVQAGFNEFEEGVRRIARSGARHRINVNASPYFATRYLLDRIARFRQILPEVDLRLTTMVNLPDFVADEVDVAIQWGFGHWGKHDHMLLLRDHKIICCTRDLAERVHTPADLATVPLLHPVLGDDLWPNVLRHLDATEGTPPPGIRFHDAATMRRATLAGLGVGLISTLDAHEDIEAGRLVAPLGPDALDGLPPDQIPGFYLVLPRAHRRDKAVATFCDWVESEDWDRPSLAPSRSL